jgi:hypothetical protein
MKKLNAPTDPYPGAVRSTIQPIHSFGWNPTPVVATFPVEVEHGTVIFLQRSATGYDSIVK